MIINVFLVMYKLFIGLEVRVGINVGFVCLGVC